MLKNDFVIGPLLSLSLLLLQEKFSSFVSFAPFPNYLLQRLRNSLVVVYSTLSVCLSKLGCDTRNKEQKFLGFDTKQKLTKEIWPKETKKTKQFVRLFSWPIFEAICLKYSPISTPKGQFKQSESKLGICLSTTTESQREPWTTWLLWIKILQSNMYCDVFKSDICLLYENRIIFTCFFQYITIFLRKKNLHE